MFTSILLLCTLVATSFADAGIDCPAEGVKYFAHPTEWGQFIGCNDGVKKDLHCPDDLVFNSEGQFCYDPRDVTMDSKLDSETEVNKQYGCCGQLPQQPCQQQPCYPTYPNCSGYPGYGQPVGRCPPCDDKCNVVYLSDSRDCDVFYICHWGRPIWKRCPSGLHFNPKLNMCDFPNNSGCTHNPSSCP